uniref:F-box domain-containing protein n=1 Tax=Steinernema glaseri TaxID=37863 RepID=A0A1I7XY16_9BILA
MGAYTSLCSKERRSGARAQLGSDKGRFSRQLLWDVMSQCDAVDEWVSLRNVSRRFRRYADSQVELDVSFDCSPPVLNYRQLKSGASRTCPENMSFGIYSDFFIGGKHVVERHDELESLAWLWPTVPLRSISFHCFHLSAHASNNDFTLHNLFFDQIATFLEKVPRRSLASLAKLEITTQDSFSPYFQCPDYMIPCFKRIVRRLPQFMESIEFQTFPSNEGLVGSLLGLKPKKLLILGDEAVLEESLDMMKYNYDTTLFMYMKGIEDQDSVLQTFGELAEKWRTSCKRHSNAIHIQFSETKQSALALQEIVLQLPSRPCLHHPTVTCMVDCNTMARRGLYLEVALSLTCIEPSTLKKTRKEVRELNLLEQQSTQVAFSPLRNYDSCHTVLWPCLDTDSDSGISMGSEEARMDEIDLTSLIKSGIVATVDLEEQQSLISAPAA